MSRLAGRNGRVYLGIASTSATASPLPFQAKWSIDFGNDKIDVTAMGDNGKTYVGGMANQTGDFSGFYDDATAQTYTAAVDGLSRKFYLYPSTLNTGQYFYGTVIVDMNVNGDVSGAVEMSASWSAASDILKVG
jgi:hypothetical protein